MNKADVVAKVAEKSGVDAETCRKVVDALEKVLQDELGSSKGLGGALDKIAGVLNFLNAK